MELQVLLICILVMINDDKGNTQAKRPKCLTVLE